MNQNPDFLVSAIVPSDKLGNVLAFLQGNDFTVSEVRLLEKQLPPDTAGASKESAPDFLRTYLADNGATSLSRAVSISTVVAAGTRAGYSRVAMMNAVHRLRTRGTTKHPRKGWLYLALGKQSARTASVQKAASALLKQAEGDLPGPAKPDVETFPGLEPMPLANPSRVNSNG